METAKITKHGSPDNGHWIVQCDNPDCRDINGRPWQHAIPRRTVEGRTLAERDMNEHNRARHAASPFSGASDRVYNAARDYNRRK